MSASAPAQGQGPGAGRDYWLPTLQLATQEVFELMLGCKLNTPAEDPNRDGLAVTAMVGLAGQVRGVLSLRCSSKSAARMASRMLGTEGAEDSQETWDAVGEVCNMIAGNFKNKISGLGDGCMLSVPTVIGGADYTLHSLAKNGLNTVLLFEQEPLVILLELHD